MEIDINQLTPQSTDAEIRETVKAYIFELMRKGLSIKEAAVKAHKKAKRLTKRKEI